MSTASMERLQILDNIEKDIITCLTSAGQVFVELSKEKTSLKQAENHTQTFLKTLSTIEGRLTDQINYLTQVSTGHPHEGSGYASQKVLQMAWHRLEHAKHRVSLLDRLRVKQIQNNNKFLTIRQGHNIDQNTEPASTTGGSGDCCGSTNTTVATSQVSTTLRNNY